MIGMNGKGCLCLNHCGMDFLNLDHKHVMANFRPRAIRQPGKVTEKWNTCQITINKINDALTILHQNDFQEIM